MKKEFGDLAIPNLHDINLYLLGFARGGEVLLRDIGRIQSWLVPSRQRNSLGLSGRHWSEARKGIGADLGISEARSEKGDLEQGKRKQ